PAPRLVIVIVVVAAAVVFVVVVIVAPALFRRGLAALAAAGRAGTRNLRRARRTRSLRLEHFQATAALDVLPLERGVDFQFRFARRAHDTDVGHRSRRTEDRR